MIKVVRFVKRRKDLTREEFKAYWLNKHSQLEKMVMEKTPMRKIVASFATGELIGGKEPPFDPPCLACLNVRGLLPLTQR
jgi:hypothetical protein